MTLHSLAPRTSVSIIQPRIDYVGRHRPGPNRVPATTLPGYTPRPSRFVRAFVGGAA